MENQNESKIKNFKIKLILVILIVICFLAILLFGTLYYFSLKSTEKNYSDSNLNKEETPPLITVIPNEKSELDNEPNVSEEIIDNDQNVSEENVVEDTQVSNPSPEPENTTSNPNSNSNSNSNSSSSSNSNSQANSSSNSGSTTTLPPTDNNSTENSNGTETTKPNSTPPSPPVPSAPETPVEPPYVVKTETSTEVKTENKYGIIIKTYTTTTYDVYSDGTKKITNSSDKIEYDRTGYNATTAQLIPEAKTTKNQYSSMINQVFKNVNSYREEANSNSIDGVSNRKPLILNENLCIAACVRALEMGYSSKFTHTRPNGSKFYSIFDEMNIDYMAAGENISYGYSDANSASEGWKNSANHYKNMISSKFSQIGIGVFKIEGNYYWVQIFN